LKEPAVGNGGWGFEAGSVRGGWGGIPGFHLVFVWEAGASYMMLSSKIRMSGVSRKGSERRLVAGWPTAREVGGVWENVWRE